MDTVPTSANQEDHVSMGVTAARKARTILDNAECVLAIELLAGAQAREFNKGLRAGPGPEAAWRVLRERVPALGADRFMHTDLEAAREIVASGRLVEAVEGAVGALRA